jgi:hypothetical protein
VKPIAIFVEWEQWIAVGRVLRNWRAPTIPRCGEASRAPFARPVGAGLLPPLGWAEIRLDQIAGIGHISYGDGLFILTGSCCAASFG